MSCPKPSSFDRVHADILRFFPRLVSELGGDPQALLHRAGLEAGPALSGGVGYRATANLLECAAGELQCPDFGMRLAMLQGGGEVFGLMGVVMKNSNTLGEALDYVASHSHVHSLAARVRIEQDRGNHCGFVGHEILVDQLPNKRQLIEQILLLGHLNAMEITGGRARVREALFRYRPLASLNAYRRYFGCDVRFEQKEDGVVFSDRDLACPIIDPNAQLYLRTTSYIDRSFASIVPPAHAQVRALIAQFIGTEDCSDERIAAELCLHPRTLRRRLRAERTSFRDIKDQVRRDLALGYLQQTDLPLPRIAEKLGYSAHSALSRSCSGWFAASPSDLRANGARSGKH